MNSPSLSGSALTLKAIKNLIRNAEHAAAMDIKQANRLWTIKKKKFEKLTRNNTM
jgi:hypothetical protein